MLQQTTPEGFYLVKTTGLHSCNLALIQGWALVERGTIEGFHSTFSVNIQLNNKCTAHISYVLLMFY